MMYLTCFYFPYLNSQQEQFQLDKAQPGKKCNLTKERLRGLSHFQLFAMDAVMDCTAIKNASMHLFGW